MGALCDGLGARGNVVVEQPVFVFVCGLQLDILELGETNEVVGITGEVTNFANRTYRMICAYGLKCSFNHFIFRLAHKWSHKTELLVGIANAYFVSVNIYDAETDLLGDFGSNQPENDTVF